MIEEPNIHETRPSLGPGYLTLKQASIWAGVSARTFKRWISSGLPTYQAGPRCKVLVRPNDIERHLQKRQTARIDIDALMEEVLDTMRMK